MFNKHIFFLLINICLCSSELTLSPSNETEIDQGGKLEISCNSSEPAYLIYPLTLRNGVVRSREKLLKDRVNGLYTYILSRSSLVYEDSGWYGCIEKSKFKYDGHIGELDITPQNYDNAYIKWVYVTVKSPKHQLEGITYLFSNSDGEYVVLEEENKDVILPCRSNSPDYTVKLYSSVDNTPVDEFEYDPDKGIILKNFEKGSVLRYYCAAEDKNGTKGETKKFKIEIIKPVSLNQPNISHTKVELMEIGEDFSMECSSFVSDYELYVIDWVVPKTNRIIQKLTTNVYDDPVESINYKKVKLELTIKNVVKGDYRDYECRLYRYGSVKKANVNLKPHKRQHLDVKFHGPKNGEVTKSGDSLSWTIDLDTFPLPTLLWVNPQDNGVPYIPDVENFTINSEKLTLVYTLNNITADDIGPNGIIINNGKSVDVLRFKVLAETSPKIMEFKQNEACLSKGATVFQCQAKGYPVPKVTWNCVDKNGNETEGNGSVFKLIRKKSTDVNISSVVKVENCPQGFVVCKVHNNFGDDALTASISNQVSAAGTTQSGSDECPYIKKPEKNDVNVTYGSPKIIKIESNKKTYKLFEAVEFSCQASGNPTPVITWEYLNDRNTTVEHQESLFEETQETFDDKDDTIVTSVTNVTIVMPGYLSCKAKNKHGDDNKVEKVDIESTTCEKLVCVEKASGTEAMKTEAKPGDVDPFSLGTDDQEVKVTKGNAVTMHCNASTSLFGSDVKWYNASNVLETSGRVEINETKEAALHSLHLTIKDAQKWDEGDYSCEGTKLDGTVVKKLYHVHVNASAVFTASVILQLSIMLLAYFM